MKIFGVMNFGEVFLFDCDFDNVLLSWIILFGKLMRCIVIKSYVFMFESF